MRSRILGWWIVNRCIYHLLYYLSLRCILPPRPRAWKTPSHRHSLPPLRCLTSLLTSPLTLDLPSIRDTQPHTLHELRLVIPAWAQNLSQLNRLVVFNTMPRAISASTALSMNVPAVVNGPLVIRSTAVSRITAPTVDALPIWPATVPTVTAPSVTPPITFLSTVLSRRTRVRVSSSTTEILRGFDVVLVVQVFEGGIVTV